MSRCRVFGGAFSRATQQVAVFQIGDVVRATLDFWKYDASPDYQKSMTPRPVIVAGVYQDKMGRPLGYDVIIKTTQCVELESRPWRIDVDQTNLSQFSSNAHNQICPRRMVAIPKDVISSSQRMGRIDIKFMADIIARRALALVAARERSWLNFGLSFSSIHARQGYFFSDDVIPDACHVNVHRRPINGFLNPKIVDAIAIWVLKNARIQPRGGSFAEVHIDWPPLGTFPNWPGLDQIVQNLDTIKARAAGGSVAELLQPRLIVR